ncbi:nucleotidyl transferase AbiEii/AbiGii toxin family protein [Hornefia butyriciproducens]|uniref:nucleotidyl transferase AbiEii/AbiGii toxin family protein n=1 Tax=Hornefia butyriciproducens TaxID=2652293 RepID=UPI003F89EB0C
MYQSTRYYCCISSDAIECPYCSVFEDDKTLKVMLYNLETIIAEKLETVVSRKTDNSRSKDFYDIYLLFNLKSDNLDKNKLREAVNTTFA